MAQDIPTEQTSKTDVLPLSHGLSNYWKRPIVKQIARALLTIYIATTLSFFLIRLMPSNPIQIYITQLISTFGLSYQEAANMASSLFSIDLDRPLLLQYVDYL